MNRFSWGVRSEQLSRLSLLFISMIGGSIFIQEGVLKIGVPKEGLIFGLLVLFLVIVDLYPMPVSKGHTAISFPLVYAIYVMEGMSFSILAFGMVSLLINLFKRRPLRIVFFNPAQLLTSLYIAFLAGEYFKGLYLEHIQSGLLAGIWHLTFTIIPFYLINNLIVDFILIIRPQPYTWKAWRQKTIQEGNSFIVSYVYLILFYVLGSQNRGEIDVFSFFFFFSPLVALALLGSIIVRLKKEKAKLKAIFSISSELNKKIASKDWLNFLAENLQKFIDVDAWILWKKAEDGWNLRFASGLVEESLDQLEERTRFFNEINELFLYHNTDRGAGPAAEFFSSQVKTLLYVPLVLDEEVVGLFVFGRTRTKSFSPEDVQSAATLANQLAVLIKTKWLFAEQEKRMILEERNRIARDIHDGVAQSLAGAVMNLETAERKFVKVPDESLRLIHESRETLRYSLKEVRESIYALRPYPTERVGLVSAISSRIKTLQGVQLFHIIFDTRGKEFPLSSMAEKIVFDTFQESVQNAIKHANATRMEILLSYQREHLLLKVKDNGSGFSLFKAMIKAQKQPHFGILHMNEAAEKIHASLQIDSKEGVGTEITLTVPKIGVEGGILDDQAYAGR